MCILKLTKIDIAHIIEKVFHLGSVPFNFTYVYDLVGFQILKDY